MFILIIIIAHIPIAMDPAVDPLISSWREARRAEAEAAGGVDAWAVEGGKVSLPHISRGMRDWQVAPCGEACCFVSCCGKTGCSARGQHCLGSVTKPGVERFICLEPGCPLSAGGGDCAMWCAACYFDAEVDHEHGRFLRVDPEGRHLIATPDRPIRVTRVPLTSDDIPTVPFKGSVT